MFKDLRTKTSTTKKATSLKSLGVFDSKAYYDVKISHEHILNKIKLSRF